MSDRTHIEWTDTTWNPVTGCTKVSQGCKHCYAERDWSRLSANARTRYHGRRFTDVECHVDVLRLPLRWTKSRHIFVNSMSDLFHEAVPLDFIARVWIVMAHARQHTFQILTKRAARMREVVQSLSDINGRPLPNVYLGVSVEDQAAADERIAPLQDTPAARRFISAEPLLGEVRLAAHLWTRIGLPRLDWVIAGGESGPHARPMHPDWVRRLRDACIDAGVPFFFKQWGEWVPIEIDNPGDGKIYAIVDDGSERDITALHRSGRGHYDIETLGGGQRMARVGKSAAGRVLDGRTWDEMPRQTVAAPA